MTEAAARAQARGAILSNLEALKSRVERSGCILGFNLPVEFSPHNEFEAEAVIVARHHEGEPNPPLKPSEIFCVIESAAGTMGVDCSRRIRTCAEASIPQFVLINNWTRTIDVYDSPEGSHYRNSTACAFRDRFSLKAGQSREIPVRCSELLPQ